LFSSDPAQLRKKKLYSYPAPDPILIQIEKKIYSYLRHIGTKLNFINHHFKLEFVDSGLYFVQDENNNEKDVVTGRIRIQ